jgi:capsular exopolysaccharide synthesis family protein
MNIHDYWLIVRKRWGVLLMMIVLGLGSSSAYTVLATPLYQSVAKVFVATQASGSVSDLVSGSSFTQQRVKSYADLVTSPSVLDPVVNSLNIKQKRADFVKRISATVPLDEVVIQIAVLDESPRKAARIANAIAKTLAETVSNIETPLNGQASPVKISTVQRGTHATTAETPKPLLNLALGLLIGLVLGVGVAVLRESLDIKVRSVKDLESLGEVNILGGIAFDPAFSTNPLIVHEHPKSRRAEAFRQLRTNIEFVEAAQEKNSVVVTSAIPGDGKTTTICNLAIALAQSGKKVLLIDCDLRKPKVARYMGIDGTAGITSYLIGKASLQDVVQTWGKLNLHVLPAGKVPPNPSELLGSAKMESLLGFLESQYDIILIDSAPLLPVTDAAVLSRMTGGIALVVSVGKTTNPQLRAAVGHLTAVNGSLLGFIMNKIPTKGVEAYQYNYSYKYGYGAYGNYGAYAAYGDAYADVYEEAPKA